ncbi:hypothetical protein FRX31_008520 [Thalictrum thalictroides]|uniref:Uncharacterized protein n=1 Tax=Thalictrum thalictroides TaxID=46969 RepID=A0A7J6WWT6_THATH|nr:hypothetical protein FRX31_008520 [Thalictrum thalictroides]
MWFAIIGRTWEVVERHKCSFSISYTNCEFLCSGIPFPQPIANQNNMVGLYLPCYGIFRNWIEEFTTQNAPLMLPDFQAGIKEVLLHVELLYLKKKNFPIRLLDLGPENERQSWILLITSSPCRGIEAPVV